jgi:hypothetical protein
MRPLTARLGILIRTLFRPPHKQLREANLSPTRPLVNTQTEIIFQELFFYTS